jgi:hypothetical protein
VSSSRVWCAQGPGCGVHPAGPGRAHPAGGQAPAVRVRDTGLLGADQDARVSPAALFPHWVPKVDLERARMSRSQGLQRPSHGSHKEGGSTDMAAAHRSGKQGRPLLPAPPLPSLEPQLRFLVGRWLGCSSKYCAKLGSRGVPHFEILATAPDKPDPTDVFKPLPSSRHDPSAPCSCFSDNGLLALPRQGRPACGIPLWH